MTPCLTASDHVYVPGVEPLRDLGEARRRAYVLSIVLYGDRQASMVYHAVEC